MKSVRSFLVIDSGSTKSDWLHHPSMQSLQTKGFNPYYTDTAEIINELKKHTEYLSSFHGIPFVYWYGSGCSTPQKQQIIKDALNYYFPGSKIMVEHDLLGAARALLKKDKGIACILGTGSNSCLYDGEHIVANIPSLGFFLGDEGSAAYLMKRFLKLYFYGQLLPETKRLFEAYFPYDRATFLDLLHKSGEPNTLIAQYAHFLVEYKMLVEVQQVVKDGFRDFMNYQAARYEGFHELPIYFTGSMAFYFEDLLCEVVKEWGGNYGGCVQRPIEELVKYHTEYS